MSLQHLGFRAEVDVELPGPAELTELTSLTNLWLATYTLIQKLATMHRFPGELM